MCWSINGTRAATVSWAESKRSVRGWLAATLDQLLMNLLGIDDFENREFYLRIMGLFEDNPYGSPNLYSFYIRLDDPALHQHPLLENNIRITNGCLFLEGRVSWHSDPGKTVDGSSSTCW